MNRKAELEELKKEYQNVEAPKEGIERIESAVRRAKMDKKREQRKKIIRNFGVGAAAALVLVAMPNTNENIAYAMGNLPLVGGLFRVVTVREYTHEDENKEAKIEVPQIVADATETPENSEAIDKVNKSIEEYTEELVAKFQTDMQAEGNIDLEVSYETVTDTDTWFALKIVGFEAQASGFQFNRFYNIDKTTGTVVELKDLFQEGADYITPISEDIIRQMREQQETGEVSYFIEGDPDVMDGFTQISENQNFYLDAEGNLVIAFDEYEVGPGYIGAPQFTIPADVISGIRK